MQWATGSTKTIKACEDTASTTLTQSICTFLMLKGIFSLSLRATQGLFGSLFALMKVPLRASSYTCVSKLASTLKVAYRQPFQREDNGLGHRFHRSKHLWQRRVEEAKTRAR